MQLTIFKRLTIGYVAIMFAVLCLGVYVTFKLNQLNRISQDIIAVESAGIRLAEDLLSALLTLRGFEKKYLVSKDQDFYKQFWKVEGNFSADLQRLATLMDSGEKGRLYGQISTQYRQYISVARTEFDAAVQGPEKTHQEVQEQKEGLVGGVNDNLRQIIGIAKLETDKKLETSREITTRVSRITAITAAIVILMGILVSFLNTKSINTPIRLLQEKTKEISRGKFEEGPTISSPPEIKELVDAFNLMCERLRELDEMKADFISNVSHELRTPLTAIREASSMLIEGGLVRTAEKKEALLKIINEECERLIRSVSRILDLSSMEAKMTEYCFRECDLAQIIRETAFKFAPIGMRNEIHIGVDLPSPLPAVKVDENRIAQVLENLLGNALKFTSRGGKVNVSALVTHSEGKWVEVSVSDTGCGIHEGDMKKIFEKFKRIDVGRASTSGTGLGLSISKHIVAAHGGKIWVESQSGKGSTFYFSVPVA
jgi:two-component system sensor histidine kinase GlrK